MTGRAHWPTTALGVEVVADPLALMAKARAAGVAVAAADAFIAAIATATANGLSVATRDMRPFEAAHVGVINPGLA